MGMATRAKFGGAWGIALTTRLDSKSIKTAAERAFQLAKWAGNYTKEKILLQRSRLARKH